MLADLANRLHAKRLYRSASTRKITPLKVVKTPSPALKKFRAPLRDGDIHEQQVKLIPALIKIFK